jgi:hypothetical protein
VDIVDPHPLTLAEAPTAVDWAVALVRLVTGLTDWITAHAWWLLPLALLLAVGGELLVRRLADRASQSRMAVELVPHDGFDPSLEQVFRYGVQLMRASGSGPWSVPRRAKAVRVRMRADGRTPLAYRVEGPAGAALLLRTTPYSPTVTCRKAPPVKEPKARHTVRAEFVLRGVTVGALREVPMEPDPLQPLADAVTDLRADLGDVAEICLDLQRAPAWQLRARRWQAVEEARSTEHREARRASSWVRRDAERADDSVLNVLRQMLNGRQGEGRRWVMPPSPRRVDRDKALGKLTGTHLVRVQVLVRCTSDVEGRARARLRQLEAALDVFGGEARWQMRGWHLGPWHHSSDSKPARKAFDHRWATGQIRAPRTNWVTLTEVAGMLKPPTMHCRLPLLATAVPTWREGNPRLELQGWHRTGDGERRMLATYEEETLFEVAVGKAGWGKTERALCQAVGRARAGGGLLFADPHGDSWHRAAPYLAHPALEGRIARIDLASTNGRARLGCWNPLGMDQGQQDHQVVTQTVDAFASALGWSAVSAPRALTIFTKAVEALVAVNQLACRQQQPEAQATVFQIRALLSDPGFRESVIAALGDTEAAAWWRTSFATLPADALPVVLNPLDRLAADPTARAFLGNPVGAYNIRAAMDRRMVVWVCPAGDGPTDRLLVSLLMRDLLRAGLSRRDLPENRRVPFKAYLDELITLDGAASESLAAMLEQLRKFGVRLHGMTQLLQRLSDPVRASLLQNSSTLTTTAGSMAAIRHITGEWGERVAAEVVARLGRYQHYATFTVKGERVGPLLLEGPRLEDVFGKGADAADVAALTQAADTLAEARPLDQLARVACDHTQTVQRFLTRHTPQKAGAMSADHNARKGEFL